MIASTFYFFCLFVFFFKQKTAYEISLGLVGSEMCIRDRKKLLLKAEMTIICDITYDIFMIPL